MVIIPEDYSAPYKEPDLLLINQGQKKKNKLAVLPDVENARKFAERFCKEMKYKLEVHHSLEEGDGKKDDFIFDFRGWLDPGPNLKTDIF